MRKREDRKIPNFKKDSFEYNTKFEELAKKFGDEEKQNFPQKHLTVLWKQKNKNISCWNMNC